MGAQNQTLFFRRLDRWRLRKSPWKIGFLLFLWLIALMSEVRAQGDLKNNGGTITNTGKIRVKGQAIGLPANIGGILEYFGVNQTIPAVNYNNLQTTGSGINNTSGGNFSVNGNLTISSSAQMNVPVPDVISLNGNIVEQGYLSGSIQKTIDLSAIPSSSFGDIGATLSWVGTSPGLTTVKRTSGIALNGQAPLYSTNQSIKRYYDVALSSLGFTGTLVFKYHDLELNGQNANTLELWRSTDNGVTWRRQGGTVNTTAKTITKTGILAFSRWTASDAVHPLGPSYIEWVAQNIGGTSGAGQSGATGSTLTQPFVVTVTDGYGNLMAGIPITFSISGTPGGATGQNLTVTSGVTNSSGQISTLLQLGSAAGVYTVAAASGSLTPATFTATATGGPPPPPPPPLGVPTSIVLFAGNAQVDTAGKQLSNPMTVTVLNQFGTPYAGAIVKFAITSAPAGATGQALSTTSVVTDANGRASTNLTLGTRSGTYTVVATSPSLTGALIVFTTTAVAGRPATIAEISGNGMAQAVKTVLTQPFIVRAEDALGNPVSGVAVTFAVDSIPLNASGQSLSTMTVATDNNGFASTFLTLGDKAGVYRVAATSTGLSGSPVYFRAQANNLSVPSSIVYTAGDNQSAQVMAQLATPFVVTVLDQNGNPVAAQPVTFTVTGSPAGATGTALSDTLVFTNIYGQASVALRMGSKAGLYTIAATSDSLSGSPLTFTATALAGRSVFMVLASGNNQSASVRTTLPLPLVVSVTDSFGNVKQGVDVGFALTKVPAGATGQVLSDTSLVTGADGQAAVRLTLGDVAGVYEVSASSGSLLGSPVKFTINATGATGLPTIALTAGDGQRGPISTTLTRPFVVTVRNASGSLVAGVPVTFTVLEAPAGASGQRLTSIQNVTDSLGRASVELVLGNKVGAYRVSASSSGLSGSPVVFTATAEAGAAATIAFISGTDQASVVRTRLQQPFVVTVFDVAGNPVAGASVTFAIDSIPNSALGQSFNGNSSITVTTDAAGLASAYLTLGHVPGVYKVTAVSTGLTGSPIVFRATAVTSTGAVRIAYTSGDAQFAPILTELTNPLVVTVLSASGYPVVGQTIVFAVDSTPSGAAGQVLLPAVATTDTSGHASTILRLGSKLGIYKITATASGLAGSPVEFRVLATLGAARALAYFAGDNQTKQVGTTLDSPFVVRVVDAGENPVPGVTVRFAIDSLPNGATGQLLTVINSVTGADGRAAALLTLGNLTGVYKVSAASNVLTGSPVFFKATAITSTGAARINYTSGDAQSAPILTELSSPLVVTVLSNIGTPVAGQTVTFAVDSIPSGASGQLVTPATATTDALGRAATVVKVGSKVGVYRITATSEGLAGSPVQFRVRSTAGTARTLQYLAGTGQTKSILSQLDSAFVVRVVDQGENPVPGASVQFSIDSIPSGATGHRLSVLNAVTDNQGRASALLTLGSKTGAYVVNATSQSLSGSPARFAARATSAAAAAMLMTSGNDQTGSILTQLFTPFVVTVVDIGGNPVRGVGVQFAVDSVPNGASGHSLKVLTSATDENGQAAAVLTLGNKEGRYTITASAKDLIVSSVRFAAIATVQRGDVNNDRGVDIADLTSVIDHILGRIRLVGNDSVRADINRDGRINIADVVALQNNILAIAPPAASADEDALGSAWTAITVDHTWTSDTAKVQSEFVVTDGGVRFNVANSAPLKGLQLMVRFRNTVNVRSAIDVFPRALVDSFHVTVSGNELRLVAYNLSNKPIAAGDGSLFRLLIPLNSINDIETSQLVVSMADSTSIFDKAVPNIPTKRLVSVKDVPLNFVLYQNYPNPFNGTTKIEYEVPDADGRGARVLLQVFDVLGSRIKTLVAKFHYGGRYSVVWDGKDDAGRTVSSGTYYYRLISGDYVSGKKMILLK